MEAIPKALSIRQNPPAPPLPDFRNLGVALRVLLGVNLLAAAAALVQVTSLAQWPSRFVETALWVEPVLLLALALLAALSPLGRRLPLWPARLLVMVLAVGSSLFFADFWRFMGFVEPVRGGLLRVAVFAAATAALLLAYFDLRARAYSPAITEARLQALTARIRPHFLFNSLNAVLSLIRSEPRRAELALEELAELFRALMRDHRELVPLSDEIALSRQYLDLEKLRLGERLHVNWSVSAIPGDLHVPSLMLQPLLENAVYHGVEPLEGVGTISVQIACDERLLHIEICNPRPRAVGGNHAGNQLALANIRERLALHYDLEASLERVEADDHYCVRIALPWRRGGHS